MSAVKKIQSALEHPVDKSNNTEFSKLKTIFEKSLAVNKTLSKGHVLSFDDLEAKKPKGYGMLASDYEKVIGMKLKNDMEAWNFLNETDIHE